jgi:hypothetical protein
VLTRALGESHHITERFVTTEWTPSMYLMMDARTAFENAVRASISKAGHP